MLLFRAVAAEF